MRMENRRNYYRILHVQRDAPVEIIKTSYRTLMQRLKMHPDLGGDHWHASLINEAFATLSNPEKRAVYDRALQKRTDGTHDSPNNSGTRQHATTTEPAHEATSSMARKGYCAFCGTQHRHDSEYEQNCRLCKSPLAMPRDTQDSTSLTRLIERMPRAIPLTLFQGWPDSIVTTGTTTDMSPVGLRFVGREPLPPGKIVKIDSALCTAIAQIRHCTPHTRSDQGKWEIGVKFITLRFSASQGNFVSTVA